MTGDFILEFYKFPVALAAGDYQGLISFDVWTSLFTLCNLLIVFYFGKKFLFGPIKYAMGSTANIGGLYDVEDRVLALFELKSNIVGIGSWYFAAPKGFRTDKIIVMGTKGKLSFSTFGFTNIKLKTSEGKKVYSEENPENIQFNLIESIVNSLNGKGGKVVSDAVSAARTNWVMEQIVG